MKQKERTGLEPPPGLGIFASPRERSESWALWPMLTSPDPSTTLVDVFLLQEAGDVELWRKSKAQTLKGEVQLPTPGFGDSSWRPHQECIRCPSNSPGFPAFKAGCRSRPPPKGLSNLSWSQHFLLLRNAEHLFTTSGIPLTHRHTEQLWHLRHCWVTVWFASLLYYIPTRS